MKSPDARCNASSGKECGYDGTPLRSERDPISSPMLSALPINPTPNAKSGGKSNKKTLTPAYAYRNADTGLLHLRTIIPPSFSNIAKEDETVVGLEQASTSTDEHTNLALYPIALNGGGVGLYRDPREFANNKDGGFSAINRTASSRRAPLKSHVRFAWPRENVMDADAPNDREIDLEIGLQNSEVDCRSNLRQSLETFASQANPWKVWEHFHIEMSRMAAIRSRRLEEDSSHVTLARQRNQASRVSNIYNDDAFDFAIVLSPHEAYAFWAKHLDFREETLHLVDEQAAIIDGANGTSDDDDNSTIATSKDAVTSNTPNSGLRRRRNATPTASSTKLNRFSSSKAASSPAKNTSPFHRSGTGEKVFSQRKSLFERALHKLSPTGLSQRSLTNEDVDPEAGPSPISGSKRSSLSPYVPRRRWGNAYDSNNGSTPHLTSPPIVSLKSGNSGNRRMGSSTFQWGSRSSRASGLIPSSTTKSEIAKRMRDDEDLNLAKDEGDEEVFLSSPGVPRGIAARGVRGLRQFVEALSIGIVVRRHWQRGKSNFVLIFSEDGGDSIQFKYVTDDVAAIAISEQAQRYNKGRRYKKRPRVSFGEYDSRRMSRDSETTSRRYGKLDHLALPDDVRADLDRKEEWRKKGGFRNFAANSALSWQNALKLEAKDILKLHPAKHTDPFCKEKLGTSSLRQSKTQYVKANAFSIVMPSFHGNAIKHHIKKDLSAKWDDGEQSTLFKSVDIETMTEGEYWMLLKGFVLLQRDASTGRFSAQRAAGFGSSHLHSASIDKGNPGSGDGTKEFREIIPTTGRTIFQRLAGSTPEVADPPDPVIQAPPSDYFLGYGSPGTQIWSRLRSAGLETQRVYALDTRRVMLKVRCPVDRLEDVAEALKLKLKTKSGDYVPFREDLITEFVPTDDGFISCEDNVERVISLFRSSERQRIISFIMNSKIRDSGAELEPSERLSKSIQKRVPLHSHARLESLYSSWVLFWKKENWIDHEADRRIKKESIAIEPLVAHDQVALQAPPQFLYRVCVGTFYQPLDEIEKYYGEKIAFYFAWIQHCSFHLLYLSVVGLVVFLCQLSSEEWDHPLRPWFSIFVMIWSFVVVVTWRRRSNHLAYNWGSLDYKEEELARPEFKGDPGKYVECPITGSPIPYYPPWKRWLMMCISIPLTVGFTILTLLGILIIYGNRDVMLANYFSSGDDTFNFSISTDVIGKKAPILAVELNQEHLHDPHFWLIIVGFPTVLGLALPLLNFCLRRLSLWLNEIENHRTEAEHRTNFIIKVFAFRFVCYFAALYYYSFIGVGDSDPHGTEQGIIRVASTLFTYITIAHWWNIFLQVFFPLLLHRWRTYRERLQLREQFRTLEMAELELSAPDHEKSSEERAQLKKQLLNKRLLLEHAQVNLWEEVMLPEHFVDYLFAVTQFAYVTCFSVILPITPLVVLINHLLNMRLDAFKLCRGRRRPLAQKTGGIGVWNHVLHIVTVIAILTNCALMALTSSQFSWLANEIGYLGVFALAICWEHFMLLVKYILQLTVSSMPKQVQDAINKKQYNQERKRYKRLRDKKRRSGSTDAAAESGPRPNSSSSEEESDSLRESARVISQASPCPVIRESPTESRSQSSGSNNSSRPSTTSDNQTSAFIEQGHPSRPTNCTNSIKRSAVNVHATKCHSPLQPRPLQPSLPRNDMKSHNMPPQQHNNVKENVHPNLDESPPNGRLQQYSAKPLSNAARPRHHSDSTVHGCDRPEDGDCRHFGEQITTPDSICSSISTVPGFPTPCHLNLDESSDTIVASGNDELSEDIDDQSSFTTGYYQHATAPPLSPGSDQYGMLKSSASRPRTSKNEDSDGEYQSKWGLHLGHFAQYARSERSIHLSEKKKSR